MIWTLADLYILTKDTATHFSFQPYTIPAIIAIVCAGVLIYDVFDRQRKRRRRDDEIRKLEEGDDENMDPKRKNKRDRQYFPTGSS